MYTVGVLPELKVGACVALRHKQLILMGKRIGSHGAGTWSFPGGHPEAGETVEEAVRRELLEETGIVYEGELQPLTWVENLFEAEGKRYVTLYMLGRIHGFSAPKAEVLEPLKCAEWRWVDVGDLPRPIFAPTEKLLQSGYRFT